MPTTDVAELIRRDMGAAEARREKNRADFPDFTDGLDRLRAAFGADQVKPLWVSENGKEIGKPQPFDGTDISKVIAADDWHKAAQKRGVRK
jgi:hypothetical protein